MKIQAQVKLLATVQQAQCLRDTLVSANAACNWISSKAWEVKVFKQFKLHKLAYYEARNLHPNLSAQMIIRANAKVADAYKVDQKTKRRFSPLGSFPFDTRLHTWKDDTVRLWTTSGRQTVSFVCGAYQHRQLSYSRGESKLVFKQNQFYLHIAIEFPEAEEREAKDWLGVDVGIVNIATTSDGQNFSGAHLNNLRGRANKLRRRLQKKGTKSAKRLLRKRRRKEQNFSKYTNHVISKQIVAAAERTERGIALENLEGIRARIRAKKPQRRILHSWAFGDLQNKIDYKAKLAGVKVCYVNPRNTSQECRVCGHIEKANRKSRDVFRCLSCGHTADADVNAAKVISRRADVNQPNADNVEVGPKHGVESQDSD